MTITTADILKIRDDLVDAEPELTPQQVVRGVRTLVHMRLQAERPMPFPLPPPEPGKESHVFAKAYARAKTDEEKASLHDAEQLHLAERKAKMHASVPLELAVQFQRCYPRPPGVNDPHHYAQYLHGRALWQDTDRLVESAGLVLESPTPKAVL